MTTLTSAIKSEAIVKKVYQRIFSAQANTK